MGGPEGIKSSRSRRSLPKRHARQIYNQLGPSYEKLYGPEQSEKHNLVLKLLSLDSSQTAIDIGCGNGLLAHRLARKIRFVVGIDISSRMIQRAKSVNRREGGVEVLLGDAEHLPFRPESFQVALAITVVLDATTARWTINEMKSVLSKDEGIAILTSVVKASGFSRSSLVIEQGFRGWRLRKMRLGGDMGFLVERS